MNILFVMYDQLRFDYLSCAGHPHLETPNFDRVAARGLRFTNAYVQSPICGSSRMSTYTGRYASSHGAQWNGWPIRVGEHTMGDHLRAAGMGCWLIGKTHMRADKAGLERLGIDAGSVIGARQAECGFDVRVRDDGLWAEGPDGYYDESRSPYNEYLKSKGYPAENPWHDFANSGVKDGQIASGWMFDNADKPANIPEEDSETAWLTDEAIRFVDEAEGPWCAHLSYIKPHWPYIVPAPYHAMYGTNHVPAPARHEAELEDAHPVLAAFQQSRIARAFQDEEVRQKVIPAYMGLIKQCDDHLGRLLDHLEATGRMDETVIVLTSDHGDYLGDHWLGEKNLFHEPSVKVPLIICDPRPGADATRGQVCDALVEQIDLLPTFVEMAGAEPPMHILEGRSLNPWLRGETPDWRDCVISEYNYSMQPMRESVGVSIEDARLFMVFDGRWKLIHAEGGFRPILFDLENDPEEYFDLGKAPGREAEIARLYDMLFAWARRESQRVTMSDATIEGAVGKSARRGILTFLKDGSEVPEEWTVKYRGPAPARYVPED